MPLFEYHCLQCQTDFECLIRNSQDDPPSCPACGARELQKQFSVPAAHTGGRSTLPTVAPGPGGCGLPQCGSGGCQFGS